MKIIIFFITGMYLSKDENDHAILSKETMELMIGFDSINYLYKKDKNHLAVLMYTILIQVIMTIMVSIFFPSVSSFW